MGEDTQGGAAEVRQGVGDSEAEIDQDIKQCDAVKHPSHYTQGGIECIDAIREALGPTGFVDYCIGNAIKYSWRWKHKGGLQDLQKASVYLNWAIDEASKK